MFEKLSPSLRTTIGIPSVFSCLDSRRLDPAAHHLHTACLLLIAVECQTKLIPLNTSQIPVNNVALNVTSEKAIKILISLLLAPTSLKRTIIIILPLHHQLVSPIYFKQQ